MPIALRQIAPPITAAPAAPPPIPAAEYERRLTAVYERAGVDWLVVHADREHPANLMFLCNFDPRFEEALLLLGPGGKRVLLVGNEGLGHLGELTVPVENALVQSFSLMGMDRTVAPQLRTALEQAGIAGGQRVGVVGWKYLEPEETDAPGEPAFVPAFFVDTLRRIVGAGGAVTDATSALMHPAHGLRTQNSADQIAWFEWYAGRAAEAVMRVVRGARPGRTERQTAALFEYEGDPLACHMMLVSGDGAINGLRSPSGRVLGYGDGITTAVGFWGGLTARAGLLRDTPDQSFLERYVQPYYGAIAAWYGGVRVGVTGGAIDALIGGLLADTPFRSAFTPGHLTSIEEWLHTPVRPGSPEQIASGMVFQCDIIPTPLPLGTALNCEDTVAIADAALRAEIAARHPELWARIQVRRAFLRDALGVTPHEDLLPLSPVPAYLPPFWLASDTVCRVDG